MGLQIETRQLAHAEPHEVAVLGPQPLSSSFGGMPESGSYRILGLRKGVTISLFDIETGTGMAADMHTAPCVALSLLFEAAGTGWITEGEGQFGPIPLRPGIYCMIAPAGATGQDRFKPSSRLRGIDIRLDPSFWSALGGPSSIDALGAGHPHAAMASPSVWVGLLPLTPRLMADAQALFRSGMSGTADLTVEARSLYIIDEAIRALAAGVNMATAIAPAPLLARDRRAVQRVIALMEGDLGRAWTVPELAQAAGISHNRLKQSFRAETGCAVYGFLQERRLGEARRLLLEGKGSVTDVALSVGYGSLSHFTALFRRRFGQTPSDVLSLSKTARRTG
ncbi:helix-turn-helix domain-containing protein (plasmid) [Rhodovulum sulfidophilum]|uniref:Helix-turn-helix domain-containing protein n=1 Tax=Rhodovulum sulfidophilum TaxID=35806 RepID=A0A0D6B8Z9_RHOSU|nr:helix-turn-helix domain-containing protein [Rhodovulum sulfidophilum]